MNTKAIWQRRAAVGKELIALRDKSETPAWTAADEARWKVNLEKYEELTSEVNRGEGAHEEIARPGSCS